MGGSGLARCIAEQSCGNSCAADMPAPIAARIALVDDEFLITVERGKVFVAEWPGQFCPGFTEPPRREAVDTTVGQVQSGGALTRWFKRISSFSCNATPTTIHRLKVDSG